MRGNVSDGTIAQKFILLMEILQFLSVPESLCLSFLYLSAKTSRQNMQGGTRETRLFEFHILCGTNQNLLVLCNKHKQHLRRTQLLTIRVIDDG